MTALVDATIEQVGALGALTESVVEIERTISSLQAARDGMLAVGARLALEVAEQGEHPDYGDLALRS
ncbi:MAG TPA: HNH endonuclease, partial [Microbacterium sp.]|nr:HNH endonuclease [Microbacterium sp.]